VLFIFNNALVQFSKQDNIFNLELIINYLPNSIILNLMKIKLNKNKNKNNFLIKIFSKNSVINKIKRKHKIMILS